MSYTYTDYHHHQFDRQFSLPLPMPSPTSCWYPQRQDVQFGYSYPDPAFSIPVLPFSAPRPSLVSDPRPEPDPPDGPLLYTAAQQPYQPFQPPSPPYQPPYNGVDHMEPLGMPHDPVTQDLEPNLSVASLVSQLERLTADVEQLVSRMDANERLLGDPHGQSLGLSPHPPQSPGYVQPSPYDQQPPTAVLPPQSLPAAAPSSMKKVTSAPNPDRFHPQSLECAFKLDNYLPKLNSTEILGSVENTFEERATDLENDCEGFSSCGEINTLHEISICVIHERDDCPSSPFGKRIMTEEFHKFDDKIINDEANSDDGDDVSFNLCCDSALDADARLIPPRTDTPSPQLCASSFWFDMSMDYPKEYWDAVDFRCLSRPYPSRNSQTAAPVVPPPPPQRSPSCWSSTSHCRSAAPLPDTAAAPPLNLPPLAPPCTSNIIGDEGDLLDDDRPPPTMMTLSYSPNIRYDSMELIVDESTAIDRLTNRDQVGVEEALLDNEEKVGSFANLRPARVRREKCISLEKVDQNELLRAHCFKFGTLEELVNHSLPIGEDLHGQRELLEQQTYRMTPLNKAVNLKKRNQLVTIGFQNEVATDVLCTDGTDGVNGLEDLKNPETNVVLKDEIMSRKRLCAATVECVKQLWKGAAFAPRQQPCIFDPGGDIPFQAHVISDSLLCFVFPP